MTVPPAPGPAAPPGPAGVPDDHRHLARTILILVIIGTLCIIPIVVAAVTFGILDTREPPRVVTVMAQQVNGTLNVTYQGGRDARLLSALVVNVTGVKGAARSQVIGSRNGTRPLATGSTCSFNGTLAGKDRLVVTGRFMDGKEQVLLNCTV